MQNELPNVESDVPHKPIEYGLVLNSNPKKYFFNFYKFLLFYTIFDIGQNWIKAFQIISKLIIVYKYRVRKLVYMLM